MLKKFLGALFGSQTQRDINSVLPIVEKVNSFEDSIKKLSDEE